MIEKKQVYKCLVCGNIVEVLTVGGGELVCCGQPMVQQLAKKEEQGSEKHLPIITQEGDNVTVKVGAVIHPMEEAHFIEWIELETNAGVFKKFLKPGDKPEITITIPEQTKIIRARTYCNIHGLWSSN